MPWSRAAMVTRSHGNVMPWTRAVMVNLSHEEASTRQLVVKTGRDFTHWHSTRASHLVAAMLVDHLQCQQHAKQSN